MATMRVAVMQSYFLPYLGYFKLMHEVDSFVLFDNAQMIDDLGLLKQISAIKKSRKLWQSS